MNAVEIEEAVSRLAEAPFDPEAFPFAFLEAFGNKPTTLKRPSLSNGELGQTSAPPLKLCLESMFGLVEIDSLPD